MNITTLLASLSGKKTYLTVVIAFVLLFCQWKGWLTMPPEIYGALAALALAFLRAGVATAAAGQDQAQSVPVKPASSAGSGTAALILALAAGLALGGILGCAPLQPGADRLVVRVEQTETSAKASFKAVLTLDNNSRDFFRTNLPAFHNFCEWLRTPMPVIDRGATISLPRDLAMVVSLDNLKLDYQSGRASSNNLFTAWQVLDGTISEASTWMNTINKKP